MAAPSYQAFPSRGRLRLLAGAAVLSTGLLLGQTGLLDPSAQGGGGGDLRVAVLRDHVLLKHAVESYVRDVHALPMPSFDLSAGSPSGLSDGRLVPLAEQAGWRGPYLSRGLSRPTPASFWSLAGREALSRVTGGPEATWGRLHRGYGQIDDEIARYVDEVLDDGEPARGDVQVTDTWIWFRLAELPAR
jgi:hypothetical protein